jgi:hypothetical protein
MKRSAPMRQSPPPRRPERQCTYTARPRDPPRGVGLLDTVVVVDDPDPPPSSAAGARYMGQVASLGCVLCRLLGYGPTPAQVHHLRDGAGAQRASDFLTMPICPDHHTGSSGIHGDRAALRQANVTELDLLAQTIYDIAKGRHDHD